MAINKYTKVIALSLCLVGCASSNNPSDPYENYNRAVFKFNMSVDKHVVRPAAVWYVDYIPSPVRNCVNNFFNNLRDFVTLGNDILQLQGMNAMKTTMRIGLNTTFGILGLNDLAAELGLPMQKNSFGNTFKTYGWKHSNYFIIPLMGPSTVRDSVGLIPDTVFNPTWYLNYSYGYSIGLYVTNALDARSKLLKSDQILQSSLDPYATVRDFYLQNSGDLSSDSIGNNEGSNMTTNNGDNIDNLVDQEINNASAPSVKNSSAPVNNVNNVNASEPNTIR
jgi:phospholipid-binding lipoprotein MlaA